MAADSICPSTLCDEVRGADLGDERLNKRLITIVEELGANPNLSIPAAADGRPEMEAAYRFFSNDRVTPQKILQPHIDSTLERISQCERVLLVQDTTEFDLTRPSQQVKGAGPLDCESRRGAFLHPLIAFRRDGVPLGTVWQKAWARESIEKDLTPSQKREKRRRTPIEDKESMRWIEGLRAARAVAATCPDTSCVCVSDSESDIYEMFAEPRSTGEQSDASLPRLHLLVRACQSRNTTDTTGAVDWLDAVRATKCLDRNSVRVSQRHPKVVVTTSKRKQAREARIAEVEVRATSVTLRSPQRFDRKLPATCVNVVLVEEPDPPADCEPIQWLLVTTLPIDSLEETREIVAMYCQRWQIEVYFRILKSGCRVEERLFEQLSRSLNSAAVYSIIAWRVMYLCRLGRECPDVSCEIVFSPSEWKSVYSVVKREPLPDRPPRLNDIIRMVANLGGFVDRPRNEPGAETLWTGLQRLHCFAQAWDTFGPTA